MYWTALTTGYRAKELASLRASDLRLQEEGEGGKLTLDGKFTKNGEKAEQYIPSGLTQELYDSVSKAEARTQYELAYQQNGKTWESPDDYLLYVPSHTARTFKAALERAGVPVETEKGKLDFHALRTTFVTALLHSGATVKDAQALARHSDPRITMNAYARSIPEARIEAVERINSDYFDAQECQRHKNVTLAEAPKSAQLPLESVVNTDFDKVEAAGIEPASGSLQL